MGDKEFDEVIIDAKYKNASFKNMYTCKICLNVYGPSRSPVSLVPCGHTLCRKCATRVQTCPFDRKEIRERIPDRSVMQFMDQIKCRCDNERCDAVFSMRERPVHLDKCPEKIFACANDGCAFSGVQKEVASHDKQCQFKLFQCPHENCKEELVRAEYNNHIENCDFKLLRCVGHTEGCKQIMRASFLAGHHNHCVHYKLAQAKELEPLRRLLPKVRMVSVKILYLSNRVAEFKQVAVLPSEKVNDVVLGLNEANQCNIRLRFPSSNGFLMFVEKKVFVYNMSTTFADVPEGQVEFTAKSNLPQPYILPQELIPKKRKSDGVLAPRPKKKAKDSKGSFMTRMLLARYEKVEDEYIKRIKLIYGLHNPVKVDGTEELVRKWVRVCGGRGHNGAHELYTKICEKYGIEPEEEFDGSDPDVVPDQEFDGSDHPRSCRVFSFGVPRDPSNNQPPAQSPPPFRFNLAGVPIRPSFNPFRFPL